MIDVTEVIRRLRLEVEIEGTQRAYAKSIGVSPAFLNDILLGKREPSGKVLEHLGLAKVTGYVDRA